MLYMTVDDLYYNIKNNNIVLGKNINERMDSFEIGIYKDNLDKVFPRDSIYHFYSETSDMYDNTIVELDRELSDIEYKTFRDIYNTLYIQSFEKFKKDVIEGKIKVVGRLSDESDKFIFYGYDYEEIKYNPDRNGTDDIRTEDLKYKWYGAVKERYITDEQIKELIDLYTERK